MHVTVRCKEQVRRGRAGRCPRRHSRWPSPTLRIDFVAPMLKKRLAKRLRAEKSKDIRVPYNLLVITPERIRAAHVCTMRSMNKESFQEEIHKIISCRTKPVIALHTCARHHSSSGCGSASPRATIVSKCAWNRSQTPLSYKPVGGGKSAAMAARCVQYRRTR